MWLLGIWFGVIMVVLGWYWTGWSWMSLLIWIILWFCAIFLLISYVAEFCQNKLWGFYYLLPRHTKKKRVRNLAHGKAANLLYPIEYWFPVRLCFLKTMWRMVGQQDPRQVLKAIPMTPCFNFCGPHFRLANRCEIGGLSHFEINNYFEPKWLKNYVIFWWNERTYKLYSSWILDTE